MLYFSRNAAEKTGNALAQEFQFAEIEKARRGAIDAINGQNVMATLAGEVNQQRRAMGINAVTSMQDIYKTFDQQVTAQFTNPDEFTIFNDLQPLAKSVRLSATVYEFARMGGNGPSHTSMSGQIGQLLDTPDLSFDGTIVPIHDNGFKFNFRDPKYNNADAIITIADIQAARLRDLKLKIVDGYFNGWKNKDGSFIAVDGKSWKGFRFDERVGRFNLTTDLTTTTDASAIRAAFIALRDYVRITNKMGRPLTIYVSNEIASNMEQRVSNNYAAPTVMQDLLTLTGIAAVKIDPSLTGNEVLALPLDGTIIAPINGSAIATVANPRLYWNSDYIWQNWGASGLAVKSDFNGNKGVVLASTESGS